MSSPLSRGHRRGSGAPATSVAIVGLGVIGGSLARALAAEGTRVVAWSASDEDRDLARRAGLVVPDRAGFGEALATVEIVVVAVPLGAVAAVVEEWAPFVGDRTVFVHTGGLQDPAALGLPAHLVPRVVGAHPIAGSHASGFAACDPALFRGAVVSLERAGSARSTRLIEALWRSVGVSEVVVRSAAEHDALMAWMSHLPQLTATALAATLARGAVPPTSAGPGARDTTRLAMSALPMWRDVLRAAPPDTIAALRAMERTLATLRGSLERADEHELERVWALAGAWRRQADARA